MTSLDPGDYAYDDEQQHADHDGPGPDPDLADGVCPRCGTPLELDGCSTANVRLRRSP